MLSALWEHSEKPGNLAANHELWPLDRGLILGYRLLGSKHLWMGNESKPPHPVCTGFWESQMCHICLPRDIATFFILIISQEGRIWGNKVKSHTPCFCLFGFVVRWIHALFSCNGGGLLPPSYLVQQRWIFLLGFFTLIVIHLSNCVFEAILIMSLDTVKVRQADWALFMFLSMGNC